MALLSPHCIDSVVAIGAGDEPKARRWIASGFIYGQLSARQGKEGYFVYLVTNRHVFAGLDRVYLRCNPVAGGNAQDFLVRLVGEDGKLLWYAPGDGSIDVAVAPILFSRLQEQGMQVEMIASDKNAAAVERMKEGGISEGDNVFVLGFPMGLVGDIRASVVVRGGVIARVRDLLAGASSEFLVDASVFPGNSGGPVVTSVETRHVEGTELPGAAYLVGVVKGYVRYRDVAVSAQTQEVRVVFEENSGLAAVHPVDYITEAINLHLGTVKEEGEGDALPATESSA